MAARAPKLQALPSCSAVVEIRIARATSARDGAREVEVARHTASASSSAALIDAMPQQQRQTPLRRALGTCSNATMVPPFNQRLAYRAVAELNARRIPGDIVELGVWKGGVSCLMAMAQLQTGAETGFGRRLWLFDTFEGMPKPTQLDDRRAQRLWQRITNGTLQRAPGSVRDKKWAYSPIDEVRSTMARTGYPSNQISFVKGKVEDTLPTTTLPKSIALLRLDTD